MPGSSHRKAVTYLNLTLGVTVLVLFSIGLLAFRNLQSLQTYSRLVEQTNRLIFKADEIISLVKNAEAGSRGYMLSHDSRFLQPYFYAVHNIGPALSSFDSLTQQRPLQSARVDTLRALVDRRFQMMSHSMSLSVQPLDTPPLHASLVEGDVVMDSIWTMVAKIKKDETRLLAKLELKKNEFSTLTPVWLGLLSMLAVVVFIVTFAKVAAEMRKRWAYEIQLEKTVEALKLSNEELEQFVYIASHHLQEPLRKLRTLSDRLAQKFAPALQEEGQFLVRRIENSATDMQGLISDLLLFSQLDNLNAEGELKAVPLAGVIAATLADYRRELDERQASVELGELGFSVLGKFAQLVQLFSNLLENSLKFVRKNNLPLISIAAAAIRGQEIPDYRPEDWDRKFCRVTFSDQGIGFDENFKDKIFQLFQRLHHKNEFPGTGIGLAICRKIVANHHGYLDARSRPGQGATFIIYLPLA